MRNKSSGLGRWFWTLGAGLALTASLPGCMAHARGEVVYDYPVTYVDEPQRIETYPSTYYHGRPAYLVDGTWYYQHDRRWVVFRDEPRELHDYRVRRVPAYANRPYAYSDSGRGNPRYLADRGRVEDRRGAERAEQRRIEDRRQEQRRAEMRRQERQAEERRIRERQAAERRADQRRAEQRREEQHRAEQRRADEHRQQERRVAEQRAAQRRIEDRRDQDRKAERERRVAERKTADQRKRERNRGDRDDRDDRRRND